MKKNEKENKGSLGILHACMDRSEEKRMYLLLNYEMNKENKNLRS